MIDYNLIIFVGETGNAGCFKLLIEYRWMFEYWKSISF